MPGVYKDVAKLCASTARAHNKSLWCAAAGCTSVNKMQRTGVQDCLMQLAVRDLKAATPASMTKVESAV